MEENKVIECPLSDVDKQEDAVVVSETDSNATTSEEVEVDDEASLKAQELMKLISDPSVLRAYRAARNSNGRRQVSKEERKKKKAKRRMAKKSRR